LRAHALSAALAPGPCSYVAFSSGLSDPGTCCFYTQCRVWYRKKWYRIPLDQSELSISNRVAILE
jgi:hypothetical protein